MWACIPWGFLPVVCEHRCSSCSSANRDPSLGQSWRVRCSRGALVTCCSTCEHRPWHPLRSTAFSRCKTTRQTNIRAPNSKLVCSTWPTMMMMVTRTASFLAFLTLFFSLLFCCAPTTASTNTLGISVLDSSFFLSFSKICRQDAYLLACLPSFFLFLQTLNYWRKVSERTQMRLLSILSLSLVP